MFRCGGLKTATAAWCSSGPERSLAASENGIRFGGAVRLQVSDEDYDDQTTNPSRAGDLDFELFRVNLDGNVGDVLLSAEHRFYQCIHTIHHAFGSYDVTSYNAHTSGWKTTTTLGYFGVAKTNANG